MDHLPVDPRHKFAAAPRRDVPANILSDLGWIRATLVIPQLNSLVDYLNSGPPLLKLREAAMPGASAIIPFMALAQSAVIVLVPDDGDPRVESVHARRRSHDVSCVFPQGWVSGSLQTPSSSRVSDFLASSTRCILLSDCVINFGGRAVSAKNVLASTSRIIGTTDPSIESIIRNSKHQSVA